MIPIKTEPRFNLMSHYRQILRKERLENVSHTGLEKAKGTKGNSENLPNKTV